MLSHCDFTEQTTVTVDERRLRPDLIVNLAGGKNIVVDAKVPLEAYLRAIEADDETERTAHLDQHVAQIRQHIRKLGQKSYWEQFKPTPEWVVLFIPGEAFYSSAVQHDPTLLEDAMAKGVVVATPITLIALLRAVAHGWQQETVAESARAVSELGREVYTRIGTMGEHLAKLGGRLDGAVTAYNETIGSLERRVLPGDAKARRPRRGRHEGDRAARPRRSRDPGAAGARARRERRRRPRAPAAHARSRLARRARRVRLPAAQAISSSLPRSGQGRRYPEFTGSAAGTCAGFRSFSLMQISFERTQ